MPMSLTWSTSGCSPWPHPRANRHAVSPPGPAQGSQPRPPPAGAPPPITETAAVVGAAERPAVVEHEPLDADRRSPVGELGQPVAIVLEVDGLPRVQHD